MRHSAFETQFALFSTGLFVAWLVISLLFKLTNRKNTYFDAGCLGLMTTALFLFIAMGFIVFLAAEHH